MQEERNLLNKKKNRGGLSKAEEQYKESLKGRNYEPRKGIINNQINSVCGVRQMSGFVDRYDTFNNHTSLSVRNCNQNFSTCAVTEEDRLTQILNSKNNQSLLYNNGGVS